MKKGLFILFTVILWPVFLNSQSNDFGVWGNISLEKNTKKWDFAAAAEVRAQSNASELNRSSIQLSTEYQLLKSLKLGASYQFMYFNDTKYNDFQPRHRGSLFVQGRQKFGDFTIVLREKIQVTSKDESERIKKSGKIDTYKVNPEWTWRNRIKVAYNIPDFPINPDISFETFYQLNNPEGNTFDKLRYTLTLNYKLSKQHSFKLYELIDQDINVTSPVTSLITGLGYTFCF